MTTFTPKSRISLPLRALLVTVSLLSGWCLQAAPQADARLTFTGQVALARPHRFADVVLTGDVISSSLTMAVPDEDVGKTAQLYLIAFIRENQGTRLYMQVGTKWRAWNGKVAELSPTRSTTLASTEDFAVLTNEQLFQGRYRVYAGYRVAGGELHYMQQAYTFGVQDQASESLVRFSSDEAMLGYLRGGMSQAATQPSYYRSVDLGELGATVAADVSKVTSSAGTTTSRTSGTNVQELGVDESDTVKVSGDLMYMLTNCDTSACLQVQRLDSTTASSELLSSYAFAQDATPQSMYLLEGSAGEHSVVTLASQGNYGSWFRSWGWGETKTNLEFLQVDTSAQVSQKEKFSIDGAMVANRRVGDTLYLVTRYTPVVKGYYPYAFDKAQEAANQEILDTLVLPEILPRLENTQEDLLDLIKSRDCYLPTSAVDGGRDPSIITITSIDLNNPAQFQSTCFLGGSEALYMTPDSLYLATTSWEYDNQLADALFYAPNHTTSIHKFALVNSGVEYRGSGAVKGHLGWSDDKKSFRMGENGQYLNVVTSIGDTWNGSSSTRLTVVQESATGDQLETVSVVDGIGKPGEQLYAARFVGNRAYLVTFRLTDPLYVVDLSNQSKPVITGELEIDGYSEYLHPVSETLLLGIGKDAIADDGSSDFGGTRGAWYQGVKVALFDVADPANPTEIASMVIGKRGTESEVLWDHHAFSFLPASGAEPARFAIPIRLHDTVPTWEGFKAGSPSAWYDYTHTGLYSFEVSASGLSQAGVLVAEQAQDNGKVIIPLTNGATTAETSVRLAQDAALFAPIYVSYADRSVLKDDAVFYLHDGKVLSAFWGESK